MKKKVTKADIDFSFLEGRKFMEALKSQQETYELALEKLEKLLEEKDAEIKAYKNSNEVLVTWITNCETCGVKQIKEVKESEEKN